MDAGSHTEMYFCLEDFGKSFIRNVVKESFEAENYEIAKTGLQIVQNLVEKKDFFCVKEFVDISEAMISLVEKLLNDEQILNDYLIEF